MNRRSLFQRVGAVVGAVAVAQVVDVAPAQAAEEPMSWDNVTVDTHSYGAFNLETFTLEALQVECRERGCNLASQYDIQKLHYAFAHWSDGETWADDTLTMRQVDISRLANWVFDLHEVRVPLYG